MKSDKKIKMFFEGLHNEFGDTPKAFDWGCKESQYLRFGILTSQLPVSHNESFSLLDVGCGFGDMYQYLRQNNYNVDYTGIDITPSFIKTATKRFPGINFRVEDFLEKEYKNDYDFVVCSGTLNYLIPNAREWINLMIYGMVKAVKSGVSFNMTSTYTDKEYKNDHTYYADPAEIFKFCKTLVKPVSLLHHYAPNDFTIIMNKKDFSN